MAFKLNRYKPLPGIASGGKLNKSLSFKVERKNLEPGVLGQAYHDKMVIDSSVKPNTREYYEIAKHEAQHIKDMRSGKAAFADKWVRWEGKTYPRKDGQIKHNGTWKDEGDASFPWEKSANKA